MSGTTQKGSPEECADVSLDALGAFPSRPAFQIVARPSKGSADALGVCFGRRHIKEERAREEEEASQAQEAHKNATKQGGSGPANHAQQETTGC